MKKKLKENKKFSLWKNDEKNEKKRKNATKKAIYRECRNEPNDMINFQIVIVETYKSKNVPKLSAKNTSKIIRKNSRNDLYVSIFGNFWQN